MDPEQGDYRLQPGSPAAGYGCLSFPGPAPLAPPPAAPALIGLRRPGLLLAGGSLAARSETVWDADTVRVTADLLVPAGSTLRVLPGVRVECAGFHTLTVAGRLIALGEPDARIHFDSAEPWQFVPDSTTAGAWGGLRFPFADATLGGSQLAYCVIEHAKGIGPAAPGGALSFAAGGDHRVENCILRENAADYGGALYCSHYAQPLVVGCLLEANHAFVSGGALYCLEAMPRLVACTLVGNVDHNPQIIDRAATVTALIARPQLTGCIVWGNTFSYFENTALINTKPFYVRYNDLQTPHAGTGNVGLDPLFVGEGEQPWALAAASPCVNAGPPDTTGLALPARDLAGAPRLVGGRLDAGCYEGDGSLTAAPTAPPATLSLRAHPNPAPGGGTLVFQLREAASVRLEILDIQGRHQSTLSAGWRNAGEHRIAWTARDAAGRRLAAGLYLARLSAGGRPLATCKLLLVD